MSGPQLAVAVDLDRTLIWSRLSQGPLAVEGLLVCVEVYQGLEQSFMTRRATELFAELARRVPVVPTTTRTVEQYRRVRLPGPPPAHALCLNGARLLVDGVEDQGFSALMQQRVAASAPYDEVTGDVAALCAGRRFVKDLRDAGRVFCYVVVHQPPPTAWLSELAGLAGGHGWTVNDQGNKIYVVPERLTKGAALSSLRERTGWTSVLAAGDSLLDASLLEVADVAVVPHGSQLALSGWSRPHVVVTDAGGVLAGEEILGRLHDEVTGATGIGA